MQPQKLLQLPLGYKQQDAHEFFISVLDGTTPLRVYVLVSVLILMSVLCLLDPRCVYAHPTLNSPAHKYTPQLCIHPVRHRNTSYGVDQIVHVLSTGHMG
jgi:hypothetical protein